MISNLLLLGSEQPLTEHKVDHVFFNYSKLVKNEIHVDVTFTANNRILVYYIPSIAVLVSGGAVPE